MSRSDKTEDSTPSLATPAPEERSALQEAALPEDPPLEEDPGELDLESRVLCPDGACVGVIGADGRCKVCGAAAPEQGVLASSPASDPDAVEDQAEDEAADASERPDRPDTLADDGTDPLDFKHRKLCSDGECVGVIGTDGRCRECGKPYTGEV